MIATATDPVQVLGFVGILCAASFAAVGVWIAAIEVAAWWQRRRARRARLAARESARGSVPAGPEVWLPELDWRRRS